MALILLSRRLTPRGMLTPCRRAIAHKNLLRANDMSMFARSAVVPATRAGTNDYSLLAHHPFGRFFMNDDSAFALGQDLLSKDQTGRGLGAMDVHETDNDWTMSIDVPGMLEDDISVHCRNNTITITGERQSEKQDEKNGYYERTFGKFTRSFTLGPHSEPSSIKAKLDNGVLKVSVDKKELPERTQDDEDSKVPIEVVQPKLE